jgi:hypothetical protein
MSPVSMSRTAFCENADSTTNRSLALAIFLDQLSGRLAALTATCGEGITGPRRSRSGLPSAPRSSLRRGVRHPLSTSPAPSSLDGYYLYASPTFIAECHGHPRSLVAIQSASIEEHLARVRAEFLPEKQPFDIDRALRVSERLP